MRDFFPGQEEYYKEEDFDILKSVFHKPCPSMNRQDFVLTFPVSGVFFEAQTMIGLLPYATIELSITATTSLPMMFYTRIPWAKTGFSTSPAGIPGITSATNVSKI